MDDADPESVLAFWFEELTPRDRRRRDAALGRRSTAEDLTFLSEPDLSFLKKESDQMSI